MATLYDNLTPLMPKLNAIAGKLGANPHSLRVVTGSDASKNAFFKGLTAASVSAELPILESGQNPAFEIRRQEAVALGVPEDALVRFGPITPSHTGGGYTADQLRGVGAASVHYVVTGPGMSAVRFELHSLDTSDPLGYYLTLKRA